MSYWECYWAARDPLAGHYPAEPADQGVHLLIGPPERTGRGLGRQLLAGGGGLAAGPGAGHPPGGGRARRPQPAHDPRVRAVRLPAGRRAGPARQAGRPDDSTSGPDEPARPRPARGRHRAVQPRPGRPARPGRRPRRRLLRPGRGVRLAPRAAARGDHDPGAVPGRPGHPGRPDQPPQLPQVPARPRPAVPLLPSRALPPAPARVRRTTAAGWPSRLPACRFGTRVEAAALAGRGRGCSRPS